MRELQGRWPGVFGVDGRPADGLQAPHRAPKALCGRPRPAPELLQGGLLVRRGGGHGGQRRAGGEQDVRKAPYHGQLHQLESPTGVCSAVGGGGLVGERAGPGRGRRLPRPGLRPGAPSPAWCG